MKTTTILHALTGASSPSGFETRSVSDIAADLLRPLVDEVTLDPLGSVIGVRRCGKPHAKRILLDAHLDEVGLIVTGYEDGGFLRFQQLGGIDPRVLPNREVTILTEPPLFGIITAKSAWLYENENAAPSMRELCIDTGLSDEELKRLVPIGTPVSYRERLLPLGKHCLASKSMDDRSCFGVILKALESLRNEPLDVDVYVVGSCCEEVGGQGATAAAYRVRPDCAIALDVTFGTTPDAPTDGFPLGSGAAIGVGPNIAPWMLSRLERKAKQEGIPYRLEVMSGETGTNGWEIQVAREGVPTALLSLPERYMHTPLEVIDKRDFKHCARLLAAFLRGLGTEPALGGDGKGDAQ